MLKPFLFAAAFAVAGLAHAQGQAAPPATTPAPAEQAAPTADAAAAPAAEVAPAPSPRVLFKTSLGDFTIELYPDKAPKSVENFLQYVRDRYYDGTVFHRVIDGFMAQGGDPTGTGMGGSGEKLRAEFNDVSHQRGICSMARSNDPNSGDSQFFICLDDASFLDRKYTVWGKVLDGMDAVDALPKGEPPKKPGKIVSAKVAADV